MQFIRRQSGSAYRRSIMAMAMIAVMSYVVAFVQSDRGELLYQQYAEAYEACYRHILEAGAEQVNCNFVPEVRAPLLAHRQAFAVGEPFLNLALSLTLAVLLSPLLRPLGALLLRCVGNRGCCRRGEGRA